MITKYDKVYMEMAIKWSSLSSAVRKKVGCLVVKDRMIISDGYNGMPSGMDNNCEVDNVTKWEVLHAEANALTKLAGSTQSGRGSTLYVTYSPCRECSKLIYQTGVKRVVYLEEYRDTSGIDFLKELGVEVEKIEL